MTIVIKISQRWGRRRPGRGLGLQWQRSGRSAAVPAGPLVPRHSSCRARLTGYCGAGGAAEQRSPSGGAATAPPPPAAPTPQDPHFALPQQLLHAQAYRWLRSSPLRPAACSAQQPRVPSISRAKFLEHIITESLSEVEHSQVGLGVKPVLGEVRLTPQHTKHLILQFPSRWRTTSRPLPSHKLK